MKKSQPSVVYFDQRMGAPHAIRWLKPSPNFPLGQQGTFALQKLPTLWWGTLHIKMKSYLPEVYMRYLTVFCLYISNWHFYLIYEFTVVQVIL